MREPGETSYGSLQAVLKDSLDPCFNQYLALPSQPWSILWRTIIAISILIFLLAWYLRSHIESDGEPLKCKQINSLDQELAIFSPLHPIDTTAYEAVGRQSRDEQFLDELIQEQININQSITAISLDFLGDFARLIQESPATIDGNTVEAFLKRVAALLDQLEFVRSNILSMLDRYLQVSTTYSGSRHFGAAVLKVVETHRGVEAVKNEVARLQEVHSTFERNGNNLRRLLTMPTDLLAYPKADRVRPSGIRAWCRTHLLDHLEWQQQEELETRFRQDVWYPLIQGEEAIKQQRFDRWWAGLGCECEAS